MSDRPNLPISRSDLDILMTTLNVDVVSLMECLVSPGWQLSFPPADMPAIHYNLAGAGRMFVGDAPVIPFGPHTLVIAPPRRPFRIDLSNGQRRNVVKAQWRPADAAGTVRKFVAGDDEPHVMMICGYFRAFYGTSLDLFSTLSSPIVEQFSATDDLNHQLRSALAEIGAQQIGVTAMTTALLKQVLVTLLRRSLASSALWLERFAMLSDPRIARAFVAMLAHPAAPHSVLTLSDAAGLSRSAFMARFTKALGCSPMAALRELRMRQAAGMLAANAFSIEQVGRAVGYESRSSFVRAFRQVHGDDPSAYRATMKQSRGAAPGARR